MPGRWRCRRGGWWKGPPLVQAKRTTWRSSSGVQGLGGFAQRQQFPHCAAAEDIPCTGGIHHRDAAERRDPALGVLIFEHAAFTAAGHKDQLYPVLAEDMTGAFLRAKAKEELHLFVTDFLPRPPGKGPRAAGYGLPSRLDQRGLRRLGS